MGTTKAGSCISLAAQESGVGASSVVSVGMVSGGELSDVGMVVVGNLNVNAAVGAPIGEAEAEFIKRRQAAEYDS